MLEIFLDYAPVAAIPAVVMGSLFYLTDKNREPAPLVLLAFVLGCLSSYLVWRFGWITDGSRMQLAGTFEKALNESLEVGIREEGAKWLCFMVFLYSSKHFNEWYDGIVYGVMIGLGFAFIENIEYFHDHIAARGWDIVRSRSMLSLPAHGMLGAVMGYFLGKAKLTKRREMRLWFFLASLAVPVAAHALYDFVLSWWRAPVPIGWMIWPISLAGWVMVIRMHRETQTARWF